MPETPVGCRAFDEDLSALIDAELDARRVSEVRSHVAGCVRCAARLEALERVDRRLTEVSPPAVRSDLSERMAARLASEARPVPGPTPPPRVRREWRAAGALAAAAVIGLAVWFGLPEDPTRPGPQIARLPDPPEPVPAELAPAREPAGTVLPGERVVEFAAAPTPDVGEEELDDAALLLAMDELADPDDLGLVANLELVELLVDLGLPEGA